MAEKNTISVGLGRSQGHQVVGGQDLRVIGVTGVGVHDGAKLVEGNGTVAGDAYGEHQMVADGERPSTTAPLSDRLTAEPVAVSVRPEALVTTRRA